MCKLTWSILLITGILSIYKTNDTYPLFKGVSISFVVYELDARRSLS
jgi:hypothetical protein